jgi:hypothetical protein
MRAFVKRFAARWTSGFASSCPASDVCTGDPNNVKPTLAQNDHSAAETASTAPTIQPTHVTVYTFVIWDHDKGSTAIYPRMATREAIAKMRGKVNEDTAWVVDAAAIDIEGFYRGGPQEPR